MTVRPFAISVLSALLLGSGCAGPEVPVTADAPKEQPPPEKKTTAELLVGAWEVTSLNGTPVPTARAPRMEFGPDGKWAVHVNDVARGNVGTKTGRYALDGDLIRVTSDRPGDAGQVWLYRVVSVNADELVTADPPGSDRQQDMIHRRIK